MTSDNAPTTVRTQPISTPVMALDIRALFHLYGKHPAIQDLSLSIPVGAIFGILGPNGSGKSTLFRLVSTLAKIQRGSISLFGHDVASNTHLARQQIGIVFQSPSLDGKLTVLENIRCQAALYGIHGAAAHQRAREVMQLMGIQDRANDYAEHLSGGLKRRVELAKGMLHRPRLLLLDEPSTGLDPAARLDLWHALCDLREHHHVTVLMTTHLLEEAEKCDTLAILHQGRVVAEGSPDSLRRDAGDAILRITGRDLPSMAHTLESNLDLPCQLTPHEIRIAIPNIIERIPHISSLLHEHIDAMTIARPSLEDVFVTRTGHRFWEDSSS